MIEFALDVLSVADVFVAPLLISLGVGAVLMVALYRYMQ